MIRAYHDNVILALEELPKFSAGGIELVHSPARRGTRTARVIAVGPGHYTRLGALIETEVSAGDRVLVDSLAGQNYDFDISVPRHNKGAEFEELVGEKGHFRIVRQEELLGVIEE